MASNDTDEVVIRRKRRRTAIDPCLGYYRRDISDGEPCASGHRERDVAQEVQETRQEKVATSDSAQNVTSPYSEDAALVTVDDFLRHQVVPSAKPYRTTHSHRKRRRVELLSEDETGDLALDGNILGVSSSFSPSQSPRPIVSRRAKSNKAKIPHRSLRKTQKMTGIAFSKRIRRAALLSHVDHDSTCDGVGSAPLPLTLAPFNDMASPHSSKQDRRIKYVDPRIPRQLDTSFANKENEPHKSKECRPFLRWAPSHLPVAGASFSAPSALMKIRSPTPKTPRSMITPLRLVPYEEHDEVRSARFGRKLSKKERKVIAPLLLQKAPMVLVCSTDNIEDDPFITIPIEKEPRHNITPRPQPNSKYNNDDFNMNAEPNFLTSDLSEILVPNSSQDVPQSTSNMASNLPKEADTNIDADALQVSEKIDSSETSYNIVHEHSNPRNSSPSQSYPVPNLSQRPMRALGSMLDTFMETARNVLLSQPHPAGQQPPSQDNFLKSQAKRSLSRRVIVSSPARRDSVMRGSSRTTSSLIRTSQSSKKVRKSISMPSVSALFGHDGFEESKAKEPPDLRYLPTTSHTVSRIPLQSFTLALQAAEFPSMADGSGDGPNPYNASDSSYYFLRNSVHRPVNLLDLLSNAESRGNAQIILSPPV